MARVTAQKPCVSLKRFVKSRRDLARASAGEWACGARAKTRSLDTFHLRPLHCFWHDMCIFSGMGRCDHRNGRRHRLTQVQKMHLLVLGSWARNAFGRNADDQCPKTYLPFDNGLFKPKHVVLCFPQCTRTHAHARTALQSKILTPKEESNQISILDGRVGRSEETTLIWHVFGSMQEPKCYFLKTCPFPALPRRLQRR